MNKKIEIGHTNISFKKNGNFFQEKVYNEFNHKTNYDILKNFDFVPKMIKNDKKSIEWEWIEGHNLVNPNEEDLKKIAKNLLTLHNSNVVFSQFNLRKRINCYRKIMNQKKIKIDLIDKLYKKINLILKNMEKSTPVHGDLWQFNILKTNNDKIFFVDWEYSHMGDLHYELAYFLEALNLDENKEIKFLSYYGNYDESLLLKHKILVNYLTILWLYAQKEMPFSPEKCLNKLKTLIKKEELLTN